MVRLTDAVIEAGDETPKRKRVRPGYGSSKGTRGDLGFEATLWLAADKLRGNLDAAEYKHVVLGLIFLKYVNDAFTERHV